MNQPTVNRNSAARGLGRALLAPLALLLAAQGCSGPEIQLSADRTTISAGGADFAAITARAMRNADDPATGVTVSFSTTAGSFSATDSTDTDEDVATGADGLAKVKLYSTQAQGSATVTASFTDSASSITAESSISITFGPPSGQNMVVDGKFRLSCDAVNIGALRLPMPKIKVTCNLNATSRGGTDIPAKALSPTFLTEAGSLTASEDYYSGKLVYLYNPKGGGSSPKDVDRDQTIGEPFYLDKNGKTRNPRDGLVTLVAVVDGEEAFTDSNGNGKYDQGEPFVDTAEPFLDQDDDDTCDPDEQYVDVDGNGKWDKANAKWDAKTKVMAIYKILWTGAVDSSSKTSEISTSSGSTTISEGGQLDMTASLLDANRNPVAAFSQNSDYIYWECDPGNNASCGSTTQETLKNTLGFTFNTSAVTERKRWQITSNSFSPPTFKYTVKDYQKDKLRDATNFYVSVTAYLTPGPTDDGYYLDQVTDTIKDKLTGQCD